MKQGQFVIHDFYCTRCGNKGISLPRKRSKLKEGLHKKKLYCTHCKEQVNHIECKTQYDVEEFKKNFELGLYKEEQEEINE